MNSDKINALEVLMDLVKEHDSQLTKILDKLEVLEQTIAKDTNTSKPK